ncbi:MAG TPA: hypothetical protein VL092_01240 [Chitinophagaceae bacterium]|nr:hypothetical protein [Chitinophagaceae bacterium]
MKNKYALVFAILFFYSCGQEKEKNKNEVVFYNLKSRFQSYGLDTLTFDVKRSGNAFIYTYRQKGDNKFLISVSDSMNYVVEKNDTIFLKLCCKNSFRFDEKNSYPVKVFLESGQGVDGGSLYYINDKLGLILKSAITWNSQKRLLTFSNNDSLTLLANILSDQCLSYDDWRNEIRNCRDW